MCQRPHSLTACDKWRTEGAGKSLEKAVIGSVSPRFLRTISKQHKSSGFFLYIHSIWHKQPLNKKNKTIQEVQAGTGSGPQLNSQQWYFLFLSQTLFGFYIIDIYLYVCVYVFSLEIMKRIFHPELDCDLWIGIRSGLWRLFIPPSFSVCVYVCLCNMLNLTCSGSLMDTQ